MKIFFLSVILSGGIMISNFAQARVSVSDGTVYISVSGSDANSYGQDGSSAGRADVKLAYTDETKTSVRIFGTTWGEKFKDVILPIKDIKSINVYAVGGDGARGSDGYSGRDGSDGRSGFWSGSSGSDGCPPSDGRDGDDGSDGENGTNGTDGGPGGDGGNGGRVAITTSADQSELMALVSIDVSGGSGAYGGSGGRGGRGGQGGRGADGGRGGRNNCRDAEGKPISGPDGRDGNRGRDGRNGNDGYSGSDGRGGSGGSSGSWSFNTESSSGVVSYKSRFKLEITSAVFTDDNENGILEPGERVYLTSLEVSNKGVMPSPAGQTIRLEFANSETLYSPTTMKANVSEIAAGGKQVLTFKKGALPLQVPMKRELFGQKGTAKGRISINSIGWGRELESGMAIGWPVSLSAASSSLSGHFEVSSSVVNYKIKNVGARDIGARGYQPLYLQFTWSSKTIPAEDVLVKLADGTVIPLGAPVVIDTLTVPAKGELAVPVSLLVQNRKALSNGSGSLTASLRLRDSGSGNQDIVQATQLTVNQSLNVSAIPWNQSLSFARARVQCQFPNLQLQDQPMAGIQIFKTAGSNQLQFKVSVPGSANSSVSPVIVASASNMMTYFEKFRGSWTAQDAADFLNKFVSPNSPKGYWNFKGCKVSP